jgi:putative MATE family efflux protein
MKKKNYHLNCFRGWQKIKTISLRKVSVDFMQREKRLANEPIKKLLLNFSIPAIVGMLVNALYNIVDRIFIGKIKDIGQYALTGVGITLPIMTVILAFSMLVGIGAAANISIRLGQKKKAEAEKILGNAFILIIVISIAVSIIGLVLADKLLTSFGASENTFVYAKEYITIILFGAIFNMTAFSMNHCIRSEGNPKRAASTMLLGGILNTILDPLFIFVFNMGVKGAAIATIISQAVSMAWVLSYFLQGKSHLKLKISNFKLETNLVLSIFSIGLSPFSMQFAASIVSITANNALKAYGGDLAIGAMTVIMSVSTIFLMPVFGINQGAQPIIGFNYGAKLYKRVKDTVKYAVFGATTIVTLGFILVEAFPGFIIKLFNDDSALVNLGTTGIRIFLFMLPVVGFQAISANFFQSIGKAKISIFLGLLRQVILLIPLYLILPKFFGLTGVWLAGPISDFSASLITGIMLLREMKKLSEAHEDSLKTEATAISEA